MEEQETWKFSMGLEIYFSTVLFIYPLFFLNPQLVLE